MFSKIDKRGFHGVMSSFHDVMSCVLLSYRQPEKTVVVTSTLNRIKRFFFVFAMQTAKELLFTFYKLSKQ